MELVPFSEAQGKISNTTIECQLNCSLHGSKLATQNHNLLFIGSVCVCVFACVRALIVNIDSVPMALWSQPSGLWLELA